MIERPQATGPVPTGTPVGAGPRPAHDAAESALDRLRYGSSRPAVAAHHSTPPIAAPDTASVVPSGRRSPVAHRTWAAVAVVFVCGSILVGTAAFSASRHRDSVQAGALQPVAGSSSAAATQAADTAPPVELTIPAIGVKSVVVGLRVQRDGTLATPTDFGVAGWWRDGTAPGGPGPAVVVGHIDSKSGPGVFYRLRDLRVGDTVSLRRADGTSVVFLIDALRQFNKKRFPSDLVYGATKAPTLRLITCGGSFDHRSGHYTDNVVAFAHLRTAAPATRSSR